MSGTTNLNLEPTVLLGMTQREVVITLLVGFVVMLPIGVLLGVASDGYGLLIGVVVGVGGALGLSFGLGLWVQRQKKDSPPNYLLQRFQLFFQKNYWLPKLGAYHYKRSKHGIR